MKKSLGMMLSMAIGDAYGAGREFVPEKDAQKFNNGTYVQHPKWEGLKPGRYTDDTQMAIAVAECLLGTDSLSTLNLANSIVTTFKLDPRPGYAQGFYDLLNRVTNGSELIEALLPHSAKSGGAMRAAPCGLLATEQEVINTAMWQASLTHATREGMSSAAAAALLVWACRHRIPVKDLASYLIRVFPEYPWYVRWEGPVDTSGMSAVHAALSAIQSRDNMSDILWKCIDFTGDTDTVAAIAMAAASMHPDIEQNLTETLYEGLEKGEFGRGYLQGLDKSLLARYPLVPLKVMPVRETAPKAPRSSEIPDEELLQFLEEMGEL